MALDSPEPFPSSRGPAWPWLRLIRGVGLAFDAKKLILAALGLALTYLGWWSLDRLFGDVDEITPRVLVGPPPLPSADGVSLAGALAASAERVADPARLIVGPFRSLFDPRPAPGVFWLALLGGLWAMAVWGIVGGAIARIAMLQLAGAGGIGLRPALSFALGRWVALIGAPLTPMLGVVCLAAPCAAMGLLYRAGLPALDAALGALAILPLLAGLVMAVVLIGLALGWPLMHAAVAAEGQDSFDAVSRAYAYVYQRPGRFAACVAAAWALGAAGLLIASAFARATVALALWGLSLGGPGERLLSLFGRGPDPVASLPERVHASWLLVVDALAYGWAFGYFWTAASIVYLLLRLDVDGASPEEICQAGHESEPFAPGPPDGSPSEPADAVATPAGEPEPSDPVASA